MTIRVDICSGDSLLGVGGPLVWVKNVPLELRAMGFKIRVWFLNWHGPAEGGACQALRQQGFQVKAKSYSDTQTDVKWLLSQMKPDPPDIVVTNCIIPAYYAGKHLRRAGIPTVGIQYSDDDFYAALRERFVFGPEDFRLSGVVCVSEYLRQCILSLKPNGVEVRRIACGVPVPADTAKPPGGILRIAYLGRMVEEAKRVSEVARAFSRATREIEGVEAVMFGDGPARPQVEQILAKEAANRVRVIGHLPDDSLHKSLRGCHAIVLLSDYEGLPMALLEGMACGCVPVCLRIRSGIPEVVEDGMSGLLVDDRGNSFVNAIRRLRTEPGLWEKLSRAARAQVERGYSHHICAQQWSELFHCLHERSKDKRAIRMPLRIALPPVHPSLAHEDRRLPPLSARLRRRGKAWLYSTRQMLRPRSRLRQVWRYFMSCR